METPDRTFFATLLDLSEETLLGAVHGFALKQDLRALNVFLDFAAERAAEMPIFTSGSQVTVSAAPTPAYSDLEGRQGFVEHRNFIESLLLAISSPVKVDELRPRHALNTEQESFLRQVLNFGTCAGFDWKQWTKQALIAAAKVLNAPEACNVLAQHGVDFNTAILVATKEDAVQARQTIATFALANGNVALAAGMIERMDFPWAREVILNLIRGENAKPAAFHDRDPKSKFAGVTALRQALVEQPGEAIHFLDTLDTRARGAADMFTLRVILLTAYMHERRRALLPVDPAVMLQATGGTEFLREFFIECADGPTPGDRRGRPQKFLDEIVRSHEHELLAKFSHAYKESADGSWSGISTLEDAIGVEGRVITSTQEAHAFRCTIEYLLSQGHDLRKVGADGHSALRILATAGSAVDRLAKLRVLLELGADPTQRDSRKWLPSANLGDATEKPKWVEVEKAVMGRRKIAAEVDRLIGGCATP